MTFSFGRALDQLGGLGSKLAPLVDRKLVRVELRENKEQVAFVFEDGEVTYRVEGDCCSRSWIEHLEAPEDLAGAVITHFGEADMNITEEHNKALLKADPDAYSEECLMKYTSTFRTTKGDVVLEYRNSSNGYYGGYLSEPTVTP